MEDGDNAPPSIQENSDGGRAAVETGGAGESPENQPPWCAGFMNVLE